MIPEIIQRCSDNKIPRGFASQLPVWLTSHTHKPESTYSSFKSSSIHAMISEFIFGAVDSGIHQPPQPQPCRAFKVASSIQYLFPAGAEGVHRALLPLAESDYTGFILASFFIMIAAGMRFKSLDLNLNDVVIYWRELIWRYLIAEFEWHCDFLTGYHVKVLNTIWQYLFLSGGGIGGGGVLVPSYIFILGFEPHVAIPLSNATILGSSLGKNLRFIAFKLIPICLQWNYIWYLVIWNQHWICGFISRGIPSHIYSSTS